MALEGKVSQHELWRKYQERLPEEMRNKEKKVPLVALPGMLGEGWVFERVGLDNLEDVAQHRIRWIAELKLYKREPHVVFVEGFDGTGLLTICDSGSGTRYEMLLRDFIQYWNGNCVYLRRGAK